jgi:HK97 family phage prohead protease
MKSIIQPGTIEQRVFSLTELRIMPDAEWPIEGYAALFNVLSLDLGGFREMLKPGAFARSLAKPALDVRALFNHDPNMILGRSRSGSLRLEEDTQGLHIAIKPPDTQYSRDLQLSMKRGDVDQMSFSFTVATDEWGKQDDQVLRSVVEVEDLYDVSIVTYPAYPATRVQARNMDALSAFEFMGLDYPVLVESINRSRMGQATSEDRDRIEKSINILHGFLPADDVQVDESAANNAVSQEREDLLYRRLEIARRQ